MILVGSRAYLPRCPSPHAASRRCLSSALRRSIWQTIDSLQRHHCKAITTTWYTPQAATKCSPQPEGCITSLLGYCSFCTCSQTVFSDTRDFFTHFHILDPHRDHFVIGRFGLNAIPVYIDFRT